MKLITLTRIFFIFFVFIVLNHPLFSKETTSIQADRAEYDGKQVLLQGKVQVENSLGTIHANQATLIKGDVKSKIDFSKLTLIENVVATFYNGSTLNCEKVFIDYDRLVGLFFGNKEKQIHYRDDIGEIFADLAEVYYEHDLDGYKPSKIILRQNVELVNYSSLTKEKDKETLQLALADEVQFLPKQQSMILSAEEGKKVLFFDKIKQMQLSAHLIKGQRDGNSGSQSIQGIGDVRFTFGKEEMDKLKKHFNLE